MGRSSVFTITADINSKMLYENNEITIMSIKFKLVILCHAMKKTCQ